MKPFLISSLLKCHFHVTSFHCPFLSADQAFLQFFGDEFLRLLLTRFVFCSATMRMHKAFRVGREPLKTKFTVLLLSVVYYILLTLNKV